MKKIVILLFYTLYIFAYNFNEKEPNNSISEVLDSGYVYSYFPMTIKGSLGQYDKKDFFMIKNNGSLHVIFKWQNSNFQPIINIYNGNKDIVYRLTVNDETSFNTGLHTINKRLFLDGPFYFISIEDYNPIIKKKVKYKLTLISSKNSELPEKEIIIKLDEDSEFFKNQYYKIMLKEYRDDLKIYNKNKIKGY